MGGASVLQMIMKYRWLKSLAAFVAAIVLSFVCAAPAFAASGSLKVVSQEGTHSYQAYKLFACDVNADGSVSNVSTAGCMPADFYADAFTSSNAQEMAEEVSRQVNGPQASSYAAALSRQVVAHGSGAAELSPPAKEATSLDTEGSVDFSLTSTRELPMVTKIG